MNIFMQGMRRSGTTIIFDIICQDEQFDPFYEPFAAGKFAKPGGGSGVQEYDLFEKIRSVRNDFMERWPDKSLCPENFNYGAPGDASLEIKTEMPPYCKEYIRHMMSLSQTSIFKFTRMYRKVKVLKEIDPDAKFIHLIRDPRAVTTSYLLGRDSKRREGLSKKDKFFKTSTKRNAWASGDIFNQLIATPEFSHLKKAPDYVKILTIWKHTFSETYNAAKELFKDNYFILKHEELMGAPAETLHSFYEFLGLELPPHVVDWAEKNVKNELKVVDPDNALWDKGFKEVGMVEEIKNAGYQNILYGAQTEPLAERLQPHRELTTSNAARGKRTLRQKVKNRLRRYLSIFPFMPEVSPRKENEAFKKKKVIAGRKNIGIVTLWNNRGQAAVSRYLRDIFEGLGYNTFILARPTGHSGTNMTDFIDTEGVWDQHNVTCASDNNIPRKEYLNWARKNSIETVFFDQNPKMKNIRALRNRGVRTVGRFVWEKFSPEMAQKAISAFDTIYSLTKCEQARYKEMGIDSPYVQWGCHPELLDGRKGKKTDALYFYFHGGLMGERKPVRILLQAFRKVDNPDIRLVLKAQGTRNQTEKFEHLLDDPRIIHVEEDLSTDEHYKLYSYCHVCLSPSRWEGLGQHFYEAIAFEMPIITNDIPPHNEYVINNETGILVKSIQIGNTSSGIPSYDPDMDSLVDAIVELSVPGKFDEMRANVIKMREKLAWENTIASVKEVFNL